MMHEAGAPATERQQAPVEIPQVATPHAVPGPRKMPPWATQAACEARTQWESGRQQAPSWPEFWQMVAEQTEPGPFQIPAAAMHSAWVLIWQVVFPLGSMRQQAPEGVVVVHVFEVQAVLLPL